MLVPVSIWHFNTGFFLNRKKERQSSQRQIFMRVKTNTGPKPTHLLPEAELDVLDVSELGVEPGLGATLLQHVDVLKHRAHHLKATTAQTI